jgi:hypothetical protein
MLCTNNISRPGCSERNKDLGIEIYGGAEHSLCARKQRLSSALLGPNAPFQHYPAHTLLLIKINWKMVSSSCEGTVFSRFSLSLSVACLQNLQIFQSERKLTNTQEWKTGHIPLFKGVIIINNEEN